MIKIEAFRPLGADPGEDILLTIVSRYWDTFRPKFQKKLRSLDIRVWNLFDIWELEFVVYKDGIF